MLDYAAFPEQRQARIRQILQKSGRVVCTELASQMNVSEHTIRRDLHELSKEGYCKRSTAARCFSFRMRVIFKPRAENKCRKAHNRAESSNAGSGGRVHFIDAGTTNGAGESPPGGSQRHGGDQLPGHRHGTAAPSPVRGDHHRRADPAGIRRLGGRHGRGSDPGHYLRSGLYWRLRDGSANGTHRL